MSSADWQLDPAELASKFSERTKAIVLNSPNNPLGKVMPLASLWTVPRAAGVLQLAQPWLRCGTNSTFLARRGNGSCGSTTAVLCWHFEASSFVPAVILSCPGSGDGAAKGARQGSEMLLLCLSSAPCLLQVFSREELELIADLCVKHDALCISDEVYEWLVYDGKEHVRIGMEEGLAEPGHLLGKELGI